MNRTHLLLRLLAASLLSSAVFRSYAQSENMLRTPEILSKSPEIHGFERYGSYNVGEYNGTVSIGVPLYTIEYRDITLPLLISYNSKGVKVDSEASWVGLNWDLNVGGCVTLIPNGGIDWLHKSGTWQDYCEILNSSPSPDFVTYANDLRFSYTVIEDAKNGLTELDFYQVVLPTASFYFYLTPDTNTPIIIGPQGDKFLVEVLPNKTGWEVTDGDGYVYELTARERNQAANGAMYVSSWYLTKITSPWGNEMLFIYSRAHYITFVPQLAETNEIKLSQNVIALFGMYADYQSYPFGFHQSILSGYNMLEKPYLTRIETNEHNVRFVLGNREDIDRQAQKLDSVIIESRVTGKAIRKIFFDYGYFTSNNVGGSCLQSVYGSDYSNLYLSKRLKLKSVNFVADNMPTQTYSFEYEESKGFPKKTSSAIDMWGYFNGKENKNQGCYSRVPRPIYCDLDQTSIEKTFKIEGANRFTNADVVDALSLKKITYPTKGYTSFTYESNTYRKHFVNSIASGNYRPLHYIVQDINYSGTNGGPTIAQEITLDKNYSGNLEVQFDSGPNYLSDLYSSGCKVSLFRIDTPQHDPTYEVNLNDYISNLSTNKTHDKSVWVNLPAGRYTFVASLPDNILPQQGSVKGELEIYPSEPTSEEVLGGGLRIKRIDNYDSDGTLCEYSEYEYLNSDGSSSGLLINPLRFDKPRTITEMYCDYTTPTNLSGIGSSMTTYSILSISNVLNGMTSFASVMSPNEVAYSRVTKKTSTDLGIRKEVSYFSNTSIGINLGNISSTVIPGNGNLMRKEYIDETDSIMRVEEYSYHSSSIFHKKSLTIEEQYIFSGSFVYNDASPYNVPDRYRITCHSFVDYWNRLASMTVTDYQSNIISGVCQINYAYDSLNRRVSSMTSSSSITGESSRVDYVYSASDANLESGSSFSRDMAQRHILNAPVLEKSSVVRNGSQITGKRLKYQYGLVNGDYRLSAIYESIGENAFRKRADYHYYSNGNEQYLIKDELDQKVYLWSYQGCYPVAMIEGLSYAEVVSTLSPSFINQLSSKRQPSDSDLATIRASLSMAGANVTTYTYEPLVGITSQTLPNGVKTRFEYDGFGRLTRVLDANGRLISTNSYQFKQMD